MDFSWNDIYQDFLNGKTKKCSEREFQNSIFSVFRYYLRWQNCIVAEECIPIGATNTIRPDFVLYKDEIGKENMGCHIEQVFLYSSVIGAKLFSYREVPE